MSDKARGDPCVHPCDRTNRHGLEGLEYLDGCDVPAPNTGFLGQHTLEATSGRVPGTLAHRDELLDRCYDDLMAQTRRRLEQEAARLGGHYAHVLDDTVDSRHDPVAGKAWLHGLFLYCLFRRREKK